MCSKYYTCGWSCTANEQVFIENDNDDEKLQVPYIDDIGAWRFGSLNNSIFHIRLHGPPKSAWRTKSVPIWLLIQQFVQTNKHRHQRSILLAFFGTNISHSQGCPCYNIIHCFMLIQKTYKYNAITFPCGMLRYANWLLYCKPEWIYLKRWCFICLICPCIVLYQSMHISSSYHNLAQNDYFWKYIILMNKETVFV